MKSIYSLVPDIYQMLENEDVHSLGEVGGWLAEGTAEKLSSSISSRLKGVGQHRSTARGRLRLSRLGPRCPKALWHSVHTPELATPYKGWEKIKFQYGHILEALAIALSREAGHLVEGEQDEVTVDGIVGHRDCVIDGCIVDVKSSSSPSFKKFKEGTIASQDSFGYLDQLDAYILGSAGDPLVTVKDRGYLLAIDKQLGHMVLYEHKLREQHIRARIKEYSEIIASSTPPHCRCGTVPYGASGNYSLDIRASYSEFKYLCFPHLRTFLYGERGSSSKIVYLSKVVREPDVLEIFEKRAA